MIPFAIFFLLAASLPLSAQSPPPWEWSWSNPQPGGNDLIKVHFTDSLRGILVADNGETAVTSDGGETWAARNGRIPSNGMVAASTLDGILILGAAADGRIWKSDDGGKSWRNPFKVQEPFYDIGRIEPNVVLAVGADGAVARSEDRGENWTRVRPDSLGHDLLGIACLAGGFAVAVGEYGTVLKTRDGGKSWERLPPPSEEFHFAGVAFLDTARGFATTENGRVASTRDGGRTWRSTTLDSLAFLRGIRWDGRNLTITGSDGGIWKSQNEGELWSREESGSPDYLASSALVGSGGEIIVGNAGTILKSSDGGISWETRKLGTGREILGMATIAPSRWLAFGAGLIMKTEDGGRTWKEKPAPYPVRHLSGSFMGRMGLLGGYNGEIFLSVDGGETWSEASAGKSGRQMFGVAWCDSSTAIAVGDSGTLLRSIDGGLTWSTRPGIPGLTDQTLSAVGCLPSGAAYAVGYRGLVMKSANKGETWTVVPTPVERDLFGFSFQDPANGMAVGSHGTILVTRDGGDNWTRESTGNEDDWIYGVAWLGRDTAVAVLEWVHYAVTKVTTDGGRTWSELPNPTRNLFYAIAEADSGRVAIMGQSGTLLLGRYSQTPVGIRKILSRGESPGNMKVARMGSLPMIQITFSTHSRTKVRIHAYTLEGRLVGEIFRGESVPGPQSLPLPFPNRGPAILRLTAEGDGMSTLIGLLSN